VGFVLLKLEALQLRCAVTLLCVTTNACHLEPCFPQRIKEGRVVVVVRVAVKSASFQTRDQNSLPTRTKMRNSLMWIRALSYLLTCFQPFHKGVLGAAMWIYRSMAEVAYN
jgi:hypothetical protein